MGRNDESKAAIRALHNHAELVDSACYEQGGMLTYIDTHKSAIDALTKHHLAYLVDDEHGVQIHSSVKRLLDRVTSRFRFRERHGEFSSQIDNLEYAIESYRRGQKKAREKSHLSLKDASLGEIREIVIELNDALTETATSFHHLVADEFSVIRDVDEKIRQIARCKKEIEKINNVFEHLSVKKIREWVQTDVELERILLKLLKTSIDNALKDLSASNRKLLEMLSKFQTDKKISHLNALIDMFSARYQDDQSYRPSLEFIECIPECFAITEKVNLFAYGNVDSERNAQTLSELAIKSLENITLKQNEQGRSLEKVEISDVRGKDETRNMDAVDEGLEMLFEAIKAENMAVPISAVQSHKTLEITIPVEDWLLLVEGYYSAQKMALSSVVEMTEKRTVDLPFDGNIFVSDILFLKKGMKNDII